MQMVAQIKAISRDERIVVPRDTHVTFEMSETEDFDIPDNPLKVAVDEYFCAIIDSGLRQSALEYLQQQQLDLQKKIF